MIGAGHYKIGSYVTSKSLNVMHLSECARCYVSEKNTKALDGEVLDNLNKPTKTGRYISFVRAQFHLGCGQTKLSELNVCSAKKFNYPIICEEELYDPPPPPEIPEATPIDIRLRINSIAVPDKES